MHSSLRTPHKLQSLVLLPVRTTRFPDPWEIWGERKGYRPPPSDMHSSMCQVSQIPSEVLPGNWTEATASCHIHPGPPIHRERPQRRGCAPDMPADAHADSTEHWLAFCPWSLHLSSSHPDRQEERTGTLLLAPSHFRLRHRVREDLQLVLVAKDTLAQHFGGGLVCAAVCAQLPGICNIKPLSLWVRRRHPDNRTQRGLRPKGFAAAVG